MVSATLVLRFLNGAPCQIHSYSLPTITQRSVSGTSLERNHQGLENRLITPMEKTADAAATIVRRPRLGGLLNYYHRTAA